MKAFKDWLDIGAKAVVGATIGILGLLAFELTVVGLSKAVDHTAGPIQTGFGLLIL